MSYASIQASFLLKKRCPVDQINIKKYKIPFDIIVHVLLKDVPYKKIDTYLSFFGLTAKEHAIVKFKIYTHRAKYSLINNVFECKVDGVYHCEEGPAVIHPDIIYADEKQICIHPGMTIWYKHGVIHNDNGPAIVSPFTKTNAWYKNGVRHNDKGFAITYSDGVRHRYLNGVRV